MRSTSSFLAVSMMIGIVDDARRRRQTWNPSSPGIMRSSTTRSISCSSRMPEKRGGIGRTVGLEPVLLQVALQQPAHVLVVIQDGNPQ